MPDHPPALIRPAATPFTTPVGDAINRLWLADEASVLREILPLARLPDAARGEAHARAIGCCKLTLEVLSGNMVATRAYLRFGFAQYALDPAVGHAMFMQKWL